MGGVFGDEGGARAVIFLYTRKLDRKVPVDPAFHPYCTRFTTTPFQTLSGDPVLLPDRLYPAEPDHRVSRARWGRTFPMERQRRRQDDQVTVVPCKGSRRFPGFPRGCRGDEAEDEPLAPPGQSSFFVVARKIERLTGQAQSTDTQYR